MPWKEPKDRRSSKLLLKNEQTMIALRPLGLLANFPEITCLEYTHVVHCWKLPIRQSTHPGHTAAGCNVSIVRENFHYSFNWKYWSFFAKLNEVRLWIIVNFDKNLNSVQKGEHKRMKHRSENIQRYMLTKETALFMDVSLNAKGRLANMFGMVSH